MLPVVRRHRSLSSSKVPCTVWLARIVVFRYPTPQAFSNELNWLWRSHPHESAHFDPKLWLRITVPLPNLSAVLCEIVVSTKQIRAGSPIERPSTLGTDPSSTLWHSALIFSMDSWVGALTSSVLTLAFFLVPPFFNPALDRQRLPDNPQSAAPKVFNLCPRIFFILLNFSNTPPTAATFAQKRQVGIASLPPKSPVRLAF